MAVQSRDEAPPGVRRNPAALVSRWRLARQQTVAERLIAFALLAVSFVGVLLFGGGGVAQWLAVAPNWIGVGSAFVVQCLCTWVQWTFADLRWRSPWWLLAFGISSAGTLLGFWPLIYDPLINLLQWAQIPATTAPYFAGAILITGAGLLDYLPEQILTD